MYNTENFQLIVDFADGSLNPVQEDKLFLMLSSDETLKQQFKSHMAVKSAIHSSTAAVTLPSSSKGDVFNKLGLALPLTNVVTPDNGGWLSSANRFIANNKHAFVTALVSITLTVSLFLMFMPKSGSNVIMNNNGIANDYKAPVQNIPNITSSEIKSSHRSIKNSSLPTVDFIADTEPLNVDVVSEQPLAPTLTKAEFVPVSNFDLKREYSNDFKLISSAEYNPAIESIKIKSGNNFAFEFRGSNYWNTLNPTIGPKVLSNFNNTGLSAFYKFSNNLFAGLDFRQETFFLTYSGQENGQDYDYQQQPNFTTTSAIVRYRTDEIGYGLSPFAQISAGVNKAGFVGRGMAGVQYEVIPSFSIMMGIEYNAILYKHQNIYFNNSKIGLNYGLMYMF